MDSITVRIYRHSLDRLKVYDHTPARAIDKILDQIDRAGTQMSDQFVEKIASRIADQIGTSSTGITDRDKMDIANKVYAKFSPDIDEIKKRL